MRKLMADLEVQFRGEIRRDEMMAGHTSWRIGGPADLFLVPQDQVDLGRLLGVLKEHKIPWMVIGNGTNLLVLDGGIEGAVISLCQLSKVEFLENHQVEVEAGVQIGRLIRDSVNLNLSGLEALTGIPGTVGGALMVNAGANGAEIGRLVKELKILTPEGMNVLSGAEAGFSYRNSRLAEKGVICSARLQLEKATGEELDRTIKLMERRRIEVQDIGGPHAGSVFKNPEGDKAWRLIEVAGLRGERCGDAEISQVHCNHIVNLGNAAASDVMTLISRARQQVLKMSGKNLELEIKVTGREVCR